MKNTQTSIQDPVCGRKMDSNTAYAKIIYERKLYYLCCPVCQSEFIKDPSKYIENKKVKGG